MAALNVTDDTFAAEILRSEVPVLVDFWAPWCGPCARLAPVIERLAARYKVYKVNTDQEPEVAARLGWEAADTLDEAIAMATSDLGRSASITYLHLPPLVIADVE